jgi:hypothetical protein
MQHKQTKQPRLPFLQGIIIAKQHRCLCENVRCQVGAGLILYQFFMTSALNHPTLVVVPVEFRRLG